MARFDSAQRARILQAAIAVFAEQGLEGATIRTVGKEAGVNSALLYYYFENKRSLFMEALQFVLRGFLEYLADLRRDFASGRERLAFLVNGLLDYYDAYPARLKLMSGTVLFHPDIMAAVFQQLFGARVMLPIEILEEGMRRGELRRAHAVQTWWSIIAICVHGLQIREVVEYMDVSALPMPLGDMAERRSQIIDLLCDGLAAPRRSSGRPRAARAARRGKRRREARAH